MITNDHNRSQNYDFLSSQQLRAIKLIVLGNTQEAIANEIGVNRETISRWKTRNPTFIRELKRQQQVLKQGAAFQLSTLYSDSLFVIENFFKSRAIDDSDIQVALAILQALNPYKILAVETEEENAVNCDSNHLVQVEQQDN